MKIVNQLCTTLPLFTLSLEIFLSEIIFDSNVLDSKVFCCFVVRFEYKKVKLEVYSINVFREIKYRRFWSVLVLKIKALMFFNTLVRKYFAKAF